MPVAFRFVKLPVPEFTVLMLPVVELRVVIFPVTALVVVALVVLAFEVRKLEVVPQRVVIVASTEFRRLLNRLFEVRAEIEAF